jgi:hypothetical protein
VKPLVIRRFPYRPVRTDHAVGLFK